MYRETGVLLWDENASKMIEVIQIYSDETALRPWASPHGHFFLDADGPSPKAVELDVRRLFWSFSLNH